MLKSLFPRVNWEDVKTVGFDMDGTLYDELDFIIQVYKPIAGILAKSCLGNPTDIYLWMINRWLEKGSSYNHIFEEVLMKYGMKKNIESNLIIECVEIYRNFKPILALSERVRMLLEIFHQKFNLFLVTDGSCSLQRAKFQALSLERWFETENVAISGCHGARFYKPSILMTEKIDVLNTGVKGKDVVFFGDRDIDRQFAHNAGFQFVLAKCLIGLEEVINFIALR